MTPTDEEKAAAFHADVAKAFGAIGAAVEVVQAQAFITRALVDLLDERGILPLVDVRERAQAMAAAAAPLPGVAAALGCGLIKHAARHAGLQV